MVTGQSVGTPVEAIRAEAGVPNYATIRKRNILTAKEKALRSSVDHPVRIAVSNRNIKQRLNRQGLRYTADQLADFLPQTAENRRPLDLTATTPWEDHREVTITTADHFTKKAATADATLREDTLNRIKDIRLITQSIQTDQQAAVSGTEAAQQSSPPAYLKHPKSSAP